MNVSIIPIALAGCAAATLNSDEEYTPTAEMEDRYVEHIGYTDADEGSVGGLGSRGSGLGGGGTADGLSGLGTKGRGSGRSGYGSGSGSGPSEPAPSPSAPAKESARVLSEAEAAPEPAQTRAWFPETFLFAPLVITDETGSASHPVVVPDRLTNWRVLGLAHGADGALAGDLLTFQGTLPVYVDPILPPFLRAGDELLVPIQAVNTTATAQQLSLSVRADGVGKFGSIPSSVSIGAGGSAVVRAPLATTKSGALTVYAGLGSEDAVERTIPVLPTGRPMVDTRAGSLAAQRSFTIVSPFDADPDSARSRLVVYPGALALLRTELDSASGRGGMAGDAYALLLSGQASALLTRLGGESDPEALRELSLVTTQRAVRHARAPDVTSATLIAQAALAHPDNPVLARMGQRLIDLLIAAQRPDGTFEGGTGWTLQRLMVTTADAVRAANAAGSLDDDPRRAQQITLMKLKASGAFERFGQQIDDPYTAASVLASGSAPPDQLEALRALVRDAIVIRDDGSRHLPVGSGVVRADNTAPSIAEATALAALGLADDPKATAWLPDLGATLMASYSPAWGWGDGRSSLTCLQAVLAIFDAPLPDEVSITLKRNGTIIDEGVLNSAALKDVLVMESALTDLGGPSTWSIEATPAVPGLGFSLSLMTWVPWEEPPESTGMELQLDLPERMTVGQPVEINVVAAAPSGAGFTITQNLPAGVQPDENSLQALVSSNVIERFETEDGKIELYVSSLPPGEAFSASYQVIPTLAGRLHSGPTAIAMRASTDLSVNLPPKAWRVY